MIAKLNGTRGTHGTHQNILVCPAINASNGAAFGDFGTYGTAHALCVRGISRIASPYKFMPRTYVFNMSRVSRVSHARIYAGFRRDARVRARVPSVPLYLLLN